MIFGGSMEKPLISVIVPIYNVENYLERCIESIRNQTYKNLEIILVDDGSIDNSGSVCDLYLKKDVRIHVIHKANGGLSSARNAGIDVASGELITFIDSDDWIDLDTYEYSLRLMKTYHADVIEFNYVMVDAERYLKQPKEKICHYSGKEILQYYMESTTKTGSYSVCRCLFPRYSVRNNRFREGKINEDIDFKYRALSLCETLVVSNQHKYYYYQSGNSLSTGGLKNKDFDLYEAAYELCKLTQNESYGSIAKLGRVKQARTAFSLLSRIAYYGTDDEIADEKIIVKKLLIEHKKNLAVLLLAPIELSRKILSIMYVINYPLTLAIIRVFRKWRQNKA